MNADEYDARAMFSGLQLQWCAIEQAKIGYEAILSISDLQIAIWLRLEVGLVEVMYTNESVLSSGRIRSAGWMNGDPKGQGQKSHRLGSTIANSRIDRSEMAFYTPNLLFEHFVPKPRLELTLAQRSRCDTHRLLTTAKQNLEGMINEGGGIHVEDNHIWFEGRECCAIQLCLRCISLEHHEVFCIVYLISNISVVPLSTMW
jgi:hypothetical protein